MKLGGEPVKQAGSKMKSKAREKEKTKQSHNMFESSKEEKEHSNEEQELENTTIQPSNKKLMVVVIAAVITVLIIIAIIAMIVLKSKKKQEEVPQQPPVIEQQQPIENSTPSNELSNTPSSTENTTSPKDNLGIQNFTENTNMTTSNKLYDIDEDLEDMFGLSLRVDYTVSKIETITDFVNYEKKRGTWGGGLEVYYLDATYRGNKYFVQVPYKYYKELEDTGIVPVSMEVLRINSNTGTSDDERVVVSYMKLDSKTLESVMKKK